MDFETAAKMSGARFVVLKGALARLERALGAFMLDLHTSGETDWRLHREVQSAAAAGQATNAAYRHRATARSSPRTLFQAPTVNGFWLIPTAEVPLTNLVREEILDEAELPMRLTA